jgi:hypothetical protein
MVLDAKAVNYFWVHMLVKQNILVYTILIDEMIGKIDFMPCVFEYEHLQLIEYGNVLYVWQTYISSSNGR